MSSNFQSSKDLVRAYHSELDHAQGDEIEETLKRYTSDDYSWRGMHPFDEQTGATAVADVFWRPFRESFTSIQRRPDIFMAGLNCIDDYQSEWVVEMGHMMGLFDSNWLGIPANRKMTFLRYVEFNKVQDGKIVETAMFCDLISVMQQAGYNPLPPQTGMTFVSPGPRTHDGLLYNAQPEAEGKQTLDLIHRMMDDLFGADMHSDGDELAGTWRNDMIWFGPAGIGATYTLDRYEQQHQGPFSAGLDDIVFNGHLARLAEGHYGGFFGWPNLSMTPSGGFLGMPATTTRADMRVVDLYRREGDKLAENWIFIDLLHFLAMQGSDVLGRMRTILNT